jgi:hypothetical protein
LLLLQIHAITGDLLTKPETGVLPVLQSIADHLDIFVMNFGLWHHTHSSGYYASDLHLLGSFYSKSKDKYPYQFFMETPKQHFATRNGDWMASLKTEAGTDFTCKPIPDMTLSKKGTLNITRKSNFNNESFDGRVAEDVANGGWRNAAARSVLNGMYGMPLVPIYNATVPAWDMHRRNAAGLWECSHYCHPSMPEFWVYMLYETLAGAGVRQFTAAEAEGRSIERSCVTIEDHQEAKLLMRGGGDRSKSQPPAT